MDLLAYSLLVMEEMYKFPFKYEICSYVQNASMNVYIYDSQDILGDH